MSIKQVIVIRKDLKMRRGKECAQASHASMAFLTRRLRAVQETVGNLPPRDYQTVIANLSHEEWEWVNGIFAKITLQVDSEEALLAVHEAAKKAGLESQLIKDAGKTEFNEPTYTAVGIGPDQAEKIDTVTGHLKLY